MAKDAPRPAEVAFGPYETEAQARAVTGDVYAAARQGAPGAMDAENRRRLLDACRDAGVELGEYDRRILAWLAGWEPETVQVVIGLVRRAAVAGAVSGGVDVRAALLGLERVYGTRELELAIDGLQGEDGYGARARGARPEKLVEARELWRAVGEDTDALQWLPVAEPLPPSGRASGAA